MNKIFLLLLFYALQLFATPQFTKEYHIQCNACHSAFPVLNETGRTFLRNGFRFSVDETTTWQKLTQESNTTYIPATVILNASYNSLTEKFKGGIKPFIAGTFTSSDSLFFSLGNNKNIYYQKNINEENHVIRAGFLSVYTQLSSVNKLASQMSVSCNEDNCENIFKTPIQKASLQSIKGVEYSYKKDNTLILASLGVTQDNTNNKVCVDAYDLDYASEPQIALGIKHTLKGYNVGIIYSKIKNADLTNYSLVSFLDKDFQPFAIHFAYIYKDDTNQNYYGLESMLSYTYDDTLYFKIFGSYDDDLLYSNASGSVGFEKIYNHFIISSYLTQRKNNALHETMLQTSLKLYF